MSRIYFIPPGMDFNPEHPTVDDLHNAVDLTNYITDGGLQIDSEYETAIEAFQTSFRHSVELTGDDLRELVKALNAKAWEAPNAIRQMNTNKHYPTSTPAWARRRK